MDAGIELTEHGKHGEDEVVAAEELEITLSHVPAMRRQNRIFGGFLGAAMIAMSIFVVARVYLSPDEFAGGEDLYSVDSGTIGNDVDGAAVAEAMGKVKDHKTINELIKQHSIVRNHTVHTASKLQKIREWLAANVSVDDGKMYEIVGDQMYHDKTAFTEGLAFADGKLFESTGYQHHSTYRTLDPETGEVLDSYPMEAKYFGEGLTYVNGKLIQLTYTAKKGFIYEVDNLGGEPETFDFDTTTGEGWGLTYDSRQHELVVSDGSEFLHFWDPDTLKPLRKLKVQRLDGSLAKNMNELEYWRGRILANIWYQDTICVINHRTGKVEKEYDFRELYPAPQRRKDKADVLNGISVSADPDVLYVTGKYWDRMFRVRLLIPH